MENRTWPTDHRRELAIHTGQAWEVDGVTLATGQELDGFADPVASRPATSADCASSASIQPTTAAHAGGSLDPASITES